MLILTRKINEKIVINKNIFISILNITGNQVKLGIEAPDNIFIYREEIYKKISKKNIK